MGRSTNSAPVKYKIELSEDIANQYSEDEDKACPTCGEFCNVECTKVIFESPQGWRVEDNCHKFHKNRLYVIQLKKNDSEVFIINEGEYDREFSLFSNDIDMLMLFISDHDLNPQDIETDTTVQQTL